MFIPRRSMPRLRAEVLASCWHGCRLFAALLLKNSFRINPVMRTVCADEEPGPYHQLCCGHHTTWNYRSGLQIIPRGWGPLLPLLWPLTWSVWLTLGEETWCRGTLPERFQNTPCCLFWGTSRAGEKSPPVIFHVALCYHVWPFFVNHKKRPPAPRCHIWFALFFDEVWCHHFYI